MYCNIKDGMCRTHNMSEINTGICGKVEEIIDQCYLVVGRWAEDDKEKYSRALNGLYELLKEWDEERFNESFSKGLREWNTGNL